MKRDAEECTAGLPVQAQRVALAVDARINFAPASSLSIVVGIVRIERCIDSVEDSQARHFEKEQAIAFRTKMGEPQVFSASGEIQRLCPVGNLYAAREVSSVALRKRPLRPQLAVGQDDLDCV